MKRGLTVTDAKTDCSEIGVWTMWLTPATNRIALCEVMKVKQKCCVLWGKTQCSNNGKVREKFVGENEEYLTEMLDPDLRFRMDSDQLSKCAQVNVVVGLNICIVNCETLVG